jgi:hypothetical protein
MNERIEVGSSRDPDALNIVSAIDRNYVLPYAVMLRSFREHNPLLPARDEFTLLMIPQIAGAIPAGKTAPTATAKNPAKSAYSIRSCPFRSRQKIATFSSNSCIV